MIIGVGNDLCDARRIAQTLDRFGSRFTHRLFTEREQARAERKAGRRVARYAQFFAAKEACAKALGTGFREGVFWRDMEVDGHPSGKPFLRLTGGALARLNRLTPPGTLAFAEIALTDDRDLAHAVVTLFALPAAEAAAWHQATAICPQHWLAR